MSDADNPSENSPRDASRVAETQAAYKHSRDPAVAAVRSTRQLLDAKFSRQQAEGVVLAMRELAVHELAGDLATKDDLAQMATKEDIARLEAATKDDIALLQAATKEDIARLDGEIAVVKKTMATKDDIAHLDSEIAVIKKTMATKEDFARLEARFDAEIPTLATKVDLAEVKGELKTDIAGLRGELKSEITQSQHQQTKDAVRNTMWIVGVTIATVAIATAVILAAMPA